MSEPTFAPKPHFTNKQLDELSKDYRTIPEDEEGRSYEPEYNSIAVRSDILKLISDIRHARRELYAAENVLATVVRDYHHVLPFDLVQGIVSLMGIDIGTLQHY
ncbi:hypothetical protein [Paenibacillus macerans]|uniref:hypothetical protein n=1 Tax=Paenibacillus macerans TaxID=44252 RepID=UPI003D30F062